MSQPIKKQQIISLFGEKAGTKLLNWLDPCCAAFCTDVLACGAGGNPSLPFNSIQYNNAGSFFGDSLALRDPVTNETTIGQAVSASLIFDNGVTGFTVVADNLGMIGNAVTLTYDGVIDLATGVANWNGANPGNTVTIISGTPTDIPLSGSYPLLGGGTVSLITSRNLFGLDIHGAGFIYNDGVNNIFNGVADAGNGSGTLNAVFSPNGSTVIINAGDKLNINSNLNTGEQAVVSLDPVGFQAGLSFSTIANGTSGFIAGDGILRLKVANNAYNLLLTGAESNGDVLTYDGVGNLQLLPPSGGVPTLTQNEIAFGSGANLMTSDASFQYDGGKTLTINPSGGSGGIIDLYSLNGAVLSEWNTTGITNAALIGNSFRINSTNVYTSVDTQGGNLSLYGGTGTGTGSGGSLFMGIALPGVISGSAPGIVKDFFKIDGGNGIVSSGDVGNTYSQTKSIVDSVSGNPFIQEMLGANGQYFVSDTTGNPFFYANINPASRTYWVGDGNGSNNATGVKVLDLLGQVVIGDIFGTNSTLIVDKNINSLDFGLPSKIAIHVLSGTNPSLYFGDYSGSGNNTLLQIQDNTGLVRSNASLFDIANQAATSTWLQVDTNAHRVTIGDVSSSVNNTKITIDDPTQLVNISNVPSFADDATAIVAGLVTGHLYKTTVLGSTFLKIVP